MPTERKIQAARANGAKSQGPVTERGKHNSAVHRLRHGILSRTVVIEGESHDRFLALLTALKDEYLPITESEHLAIETMAVARWRQQRLWGLENVGMVREIGAQKSAAEQHPATRTLQALRTWSDQSGSLELITRYDTRLDRQYSRALTRFHEIRNHNQLGKENFGGRSHQVVENTEPIEK